MIERKTDESDDAFFARIAAEDGIARKPGIQITVTFDPGPDDLVLASIRMAPDGAVRAWRLNGEQRDHVQFDMQPVPDWEAVGMFSVVELLAKPSRSAESGR